MRHNTDNAEGAAEFLRPISTSAVGLEEVLGPRSPSPAGEVPRVRSPSVSSHRSASSATATSVFSEGQSSEFSDASSIASGHLKSRRLVNFVMRNVTLQNLLWQLYGDFGPAEFEKKLRTSLLKFARNIRLEAGSSDMIEASRTVKYLSRAAAIAIRVIFSSESPGVIKPQEVDSEESEEEGYEYGAKEEEEIGEQNILPALEDDLLASSAYRLLIENLEVLLEADAVMMSLFEIWPFSHDRSAPLQIDYEMEWDVPTLLSYLPPGTTLGNVMTLSGSSTEAQAQSCEEYLTQKWPCIGALLLSVLEEALRHSTPGKSSLGEISRFCGSHEHTVENENNWVRLRVVDVSGTEFVRNKSYMIISVTATHQTHAQVLAALTWLCSAIRWSEHPSVVYSSTLISIPGRKRLKRETLSLALKLGGLEPFRAQKFCWHSLFPHHVVAKGYPISTRNEGVGLEISFVNLALATKCLSFVEYDGGLIAHGLSSILIPMTELGKDDALQWHFENKTNQRGYKVAKVSQILRIHGIRNWHRELVPDELVSRRCFLGWADKSFFTIGTKDYQTDFAWSGAPKNPAVSMVRSYSFTFGTSGMGYMTAEGTQTTVRTAMQTVLTSDTRNEIQDLLRLGDENYVLVFDTAAKIG